MSDIIIPIIPTSQKSRAIRKIAKTNDFTSKNIVISICYFTGVGRMDDD